MFTKDDPKMSLVKKVSYLIYCWNMYLLKNIFTSHGQRQSEDRFQSALI